MLVKGALGIFVYIWIRGTYPRLRYDQLMNLGWKTLLPLATANLMTIATWIVVTRVYGTAAGWATALLIFIVGFGIVGLVRRRKGPDQVLASRTVGYAPETSRPAVAPTVVEPELEPVA